MIKCRAIDVYRRKVAELEEALEIREVVIKAIEDRVKHIEARAEAEKVKVIAEAKLNAIKELKASEDFENEVAEGFSLAYKIWLRSLKGASCLVAP